jgi:hypothetical protein
MRCGLGGLLLCTKRNKKQKQYERGEEKGYGARLLSLSLSFNERKKETKHMRD